MGGYGAAYYASQRPGYFGIAAALSGRLSIRDPTLHGLLDYALSDPERQAFYWEGHDPVALVRNLGWTRLYVSAGDGEPNVLRLSRRFVTAARGPAFRSCSGSSPEGMTTS